METEEEELVELVEVEAVIKTMNAIAVPSPIRQALTRDLGPVALRMREYAGFADSVKVTNKAEDDAVTEMDKRIAADIKAVENHDVLAKIIRGLDQLHGRATAARSMFVTPMKAWRRIIREPALAWQAEEKRKADEIARKAQAEADAKAQLEREKQEAEARRQRQIEEDARRKAEDARRKADKAKGAERDRLEAMANAADRQANAAAVKADDRQEQAAAVCAPTVHVEVPESGLRVRRAWKVRKIDPDAFYRALATRPDLRDFAEIATARMERAKAANPSMDVPGIIFELITR